MPGGDKRLKTFECGFSDTGFPPPVKSEPKFNPPKYFRVRALVVKFQTGYE